MPDRIYSRRSLLSALGTTGIAVTAGCLKNGSDDFGNIAGMEGGEILSSGSSSMFGVTPRRQGVQPAGPTQKPTVGWRFKTTGRFESTAAIVGGTVFVGNENGRIFAIDANTGTELWNYQTDADIASSPAVQDGRVFVGSLDGSFLALNTADGTLEWNRSIPDGVFSSPALVDDELYFGGLDGTVYAIDSTTGAERWQTKTPAPVFCSPAVDDQRVYVGSYDRSLYALNRTDGSIAWQSPTNDFVYTLVIVQDGTVYTGRDGVTAYDAVTGDQQWQVSRSRQSSYPACTDTRVFTATNAVEAFDLSNGQREWEFESENSFFNTIAIGGERVFAGDIDGKLISLTREEGELLWSLSVEDKIHSLAIVENALFVGTGDAKKSLYGFGFAEREN